MIYIETNSTDAAYNFACEVFCMRKFKNYSKIMLIWQADNCVMLGRYQIAQSEINKNTVKKIGANIVRRNTGGGTIYTDLGNLLYTVIIPVNNLEDIDFSKVCNPIVNVLNEMGINAELKGRNDILIDGKKISGNAQTIEKNVLCSHGSLLYNANLDVLQDLLVVDEAKIKSKGISSIRSRVTNIIEYIPERYSIHEFWNRLKEKLFQEEEVDFYQFTPKDIEEIEDIKSEKFAAWQWNFGNAPKFNYQNEIRFPGGKVSASLYIDSGIIKKCRISGDFLGLVPMESLEEFIIGTNYNYGDINSKLCEVDFNLYFRGISKEEFLKCILG